MNIGLYQAISGMNSSWAQQQLIAANLARSNMPGHRAEMPAFEVKNNPNQISPTAIDAMASPIEVKHWVNFDQGSLQPSNNPNHLAIQGDAFFSVRRKDGTIAYTRNGEFNRTVDGRLVQNDGAELLLEGNIPLKLEDKEDLVLSPDGTANSGANQIGKLGLVRFEDKNRTLVQAGDGRFELADRKKMMQGIETGGQVMQGYLECSNTEPVQQMVNMMEVTKVYEANQKMATTEDTLTGNLIRTVGGQ